MSFSNQFRGGQHPGTLNNPKPIPTYSSPVGVGFGAKTNAVNRNNYMAWQAGDKKLPRPLSHFSSPVGYSGWGHNGAANAANRNAQLSYQDKQRYNRELNNQHPVTGAPSWASQQQAMQPQANGSFGVQPLGWGNGGNMPGARPMHTPRETNSWLSQQTAAAHGQADPLMHMKATDRQGISRGASAESRAAPAVATAMAKAGQYATTIPFGDEMENRGSALQQQALWNTEGYKNAGLDQQLAGIQNNAQLQRDSMLNQYFQMIMNQG